MKVKGEVKTGSLKAASQNQNQHPRHRKQAPRDAGFILLNRIGDIKQKRKSKARSKQAA